MHNFKALFFDLIRLLFKIYPFEKLLVKWVKDKTDGSLVYQLVPHSDTYKNEEFRIIERNGIKLKFFLCDYLGHLLYFQYRNQELDSYKSLFKLVKTNSVCLDIGSNIGYVGIMMANMAPEGLVVGFEPDPTNFKRLKENLSYNELSNVHVHNFGLGEQSTQKNMFINPINRGGNCIIEGQSGVEVAIMRLDDFLTREPLPRVDLVKIDVEGYELKVLRGGRQILTTYFPILFIEINDGNLKRYGDTAGELLQFLKSMGYTSFSHGITQEIITQEFDFINQHFDLVAMR
ncbi:hypothetical protein MASR2M41_17670 [Flammeovirgaceae bacterium]